jgi:hypothetical protein
MKRSTVLAGSVMAAFTFCAGIAQAADAGTALAYPAHGQSDKQQARDRQECAGWAKQQSGYDPAAAQVLAAAPSPATPAPQGTGTQGVLTGAAGGAAVAELSHHDVGRGAAIGVLGAGARERIKQQKAAVAQQQQQQAKQQQLAQQKGLNDRAFAACMEGRGYVLK